VLLQLVVVVAQEATKVAAEAPWHIKHLQQLSQEPHILLLLEQAGPMLFLPLVYLGNTVHSVLI
jgi:uncharacterized protein YciI